MRKTEGGVSHNPADGPPGSSSPSGHTPSLSQKILVEKLVYYKNIKIISIFNRNVKAMMEKRNEKMYITGRFIKSLTATSDTNLGGEGSTISWG